MRALCRRIKAHRRWRRLAVLVALAAVTVGSGCSDVNRHGQPPGPADPYARELEGTDSVVRPAAPRGEVAVLARGLQAHGFFCAQVRSSAEARQVWCRAVESALPTTDPVPVTTVDVVTTPAGDLQYLRVNLPRGPGRPVAGPGWDPDARLAEVLDASVFRLWPDDAAAVSGIIDRVRDPGSGWDPNDPRPPARATVGTDHAEYFVGEGDAFAGDVLVAGRPALTFVAATTHLTAAWPSSSAHALTSAVAAAPALEAGGFDCYGEAQNPCTRSTGNQQVEYTTVAGFDRVVAVSLFIPGDAAVDGSWRSLADVGLPQGLVFLTDAVRPAVEERLDRARRDGRSYIGIVDGALVIIDVPPSPVRRHGDVAVPVQLTVGAPLVAGPWP